MPSHRRSLRHTFSFCICCICDALDFAEGWCLLFFLLVSDELAGSMGGLSLDMDCSGSSVLCFPVDGPNLEFSMCDS